jgi:hypothetical protein
MMAQIRVQKASFAAGEISEDLLGRGDLRAYENGALKLRNVFIYATGGVTRRHGLRFVDMAWGVGRLVSFEFNTEQVYLLVFADRRVDVYRGESHVAGFDSPWAASQIAQIAWTQSADTLLVVHPEVAPKKITRSSDSEWDLTDWSFQSKNDRIYWPHFKFAVPTVTLQPSGTTGSVQPPHLPGSFRRNTSVFDCASKTRKCRSRVCFRQTACRPTSRRRWREPPPPQTGRSKRSRLPEGGRRASAFIRTDW